MTENDREQEFINKLAAQLGHDLGSFYVSRDSADWLPHAKGLLQFFKDNGYQTLPDNVNPAQIKALPELIAIAEYLRDYGWNAGVSDDAEEALKKAGVK